MRPTALPNERILVIKLAALGDIVQAFGPFQAIRDAHPGAHITLLTTAPYATFLRPSPWFDDVWIDARPKALDLGGWLRLRQQLRGERFSRVYDLQTSDRSSAYRRLFWPGQNPEWSGIAKGCSHSHSNPERDAMHTMDRQLEQLEMAGIHAFPDSDLTWLDSESKTPVIDGAYALIVPGGSAGRLRKRWPADRFSALAARLVKAGITPVLIGGNADQEATALIAAAVPSTIDLTGRTTLADIFALAGPAKFSVGNDTGPMHLIALAGCSTTVLFSNDSDPAICAPRGADVHVIQVPDLQNLVEEQVWEPLRLS